MAAYVTNTTSNYSINSNYNQMNTTTATGDSGGYWVTTTPSYTAINHYDDYIKQLLEDLKNAPITTTTNKYTIEKENEKMANNVFNFGPYSTSCIRLSLYGMAIKNKNGKWVSYDRTSKRLIDVEVFNIEIDSSKVFYKLPKAIKEVKAGDIILHNDKPMFVEEVRDNGKFDVIDPYEGTAVTILPLTSPFGFDYVTVIVSLTEFLPEANDNNPFGNLLPFILSGDNGMMMAMLMAKDMDDIDPMMLMMMNGKGDMSSYLLMKMMMNKKDQKRRNSHIKDLDDYLAHRRAMYGPGIEDPDD